MIKVEIIEPTKKEAYKFDITIRLVKNDERALTNQYVANELRNKEITSEIAKEMIKKIADLIEKY